MTDPPPLGPHCVGERVVVRHLVAGETGPSGGPAMTDVRGVLESWVDGIVTVQTDQGPRQIDVASIVAGKPIPPPPERRRSGRG